MEEDGAFDMKLEGDQSEEVTMAEGMMLGILGEFDDAWVSAA